EFTVFPESSTGPNHLLRIFRELTRWPLAISDDAPEIALPLQSLANHWRLIVLQIFGTFFRWICVALAVTGFGAWIWDGMRLIRAQTELSLFGVATAALGGSLAVLLVNLLVHVVSFPNFGPTALNEGYPLLVLFGLTAWFAAIQPAV